MIFKNIKKYLIISLLLFIPSIIYAYSDYIIASGENIGIKVNSNGLLVVGTYQVNGVNISSNSGIQVGDTIIDNIDNFTNKINNTNCDKLDIRYLRGNNEYTTTLDLVLDNGVCKTGY